MYKWYKAPFLKIISHFGKKIEKKHFREPPIYIGGCGRSGTTLLLSILSSHPKIFACPKELGIFNDVDKKDKNNTNPPRKDRLYKTFLTEKIDDSCSRWCEKSPSNVKYIKQIDAHHKGRFKFIHIVRDGRDVILSRHPKDPDRYWVEPSRWINDVKKGKNLYEHPNVYTLRYRDIIMDYDDQIKEICEFLDLELVDELKNWHSNTQVKKNKAYYGEVKPIFKSSISKWKKPENKKRAMELMQYDEAKELLKFFDYEV
ncbi:MAG: sulfotransferase [Cytophagales bacterium]